MSYVTLAIVIAILFLIACCLFFVARIFKNKNAPAVEAEETEQAKIKKEKFDAWLEFRKARWGKWFDGKK